jgi:diacylglycerol O-acyltransferase-1
LRILTNFSLLRSSVRLHGFVLADLSSLFSYSLETWEQFPFVTGMLLLQMFIITAYVIESLLSRQKLYEPIGMMLHHINIHVSLATSLFIVWNFIEKPAVGGCLLMNASITWMKLISYVLANQDYRLSANSKEGDSHQATLALIENLDSNDLDIQYPR